MLWENGIATRATAGGLLGMLTVVSLLIVAAPTRAEDTAEPLPTDPSANGPGGEAPAPADEVSPLYQAVMESRKTGPARIPLKEEAILDLPEAMAFVPLPAAADLMTAMGNIVDEQFLGLVMPVEEDATWFMTVDYVDAGYVSDEDAKDWNHDDLLTSLKDGAKEANEWREQEGFTPIEVTGWVEPPHYDPARHHLVWSAGIKDVGEPARPDDGVNYNTYVLGRGGYLSMNFVTSADLIGEQKAIAHRLLQATRFNEGRSYADFDSSTDEVAAYGLAALVGGAAAKKLGLLAVAAAFLAKAWKVIILAVAAGGAAFTRRFRRDKSA